jgi:hypothetical protein
VVRLAGDGHAVEHPRTIEGLEPPGPHDRGDLKRSLQRVPIQPRERIIFVGREDQ